MTTHHSPFIVKTNIKDLPTSELLQALVGHPTAHALADRPLAELFALHPVPRVSDNLSQTPHSFQIARELLARALEEQIQGTVALDAPDKVQDLLRLRYAGLAHELFVVWLLDAQHQLLGTVDLFRGSLSQTSVYPREVVKLALDWNAAAVILIHNHPSGSPEPSTADLHLTRTLREALALVDVRVLDHFVVAGTTKPTSFAERGLL